MARSSSGFRSLSSPSKGKKQIPPRSNNMSAPKSPKRSQETQKSSYTEMNSTTKSTCSNDTTPPKANGVHGFMFTSPVRSSKKDTSKSLDTKEVPRTKLFAVTENGKNENFRKEPDLHCYESIVSDQFHEKDETAKDSLVCNLFSPYPTHQHSHCSKYNTRSAARLKDEAIEESGLETEPDVNLSGESMPHNLDFTNHPSGMDTSDLDSIETIESYLTVAKLKSQKPYNTTLSKHIPPKRKGDNRMTLVLDLDETLVHCSTDPTQLPNYDLNFDVEFQNRTFHVYVKTRPYVLELLKQASKEFEVIIFTASQKIYADRLLDLLDPERKWTKYRLFRDSCVPVEGTFIKDLSVLGRDLNRVVIVDNALEAFSFQIENGIPIKSFFNEQDDQELPRLWTFLQKLAQTADVRPVLNKTFDLNKKIHYVVSQFKEV